MKSRINKIVFEAVDEINRDLLPAQRLEKTMQTPLSGNMAQLDSMNLLNFILEVEKRLEDELGVSISLIDENAMPAEINPFLTIETFINYISSKVNNFQKKGHSEISDDNNTDLIGIVGVIDVIDV
jgi:acyl carrier protein